MRGFWFARWPDTMALPHQGRQNMIHEPAAKPREASAPAAPEPTRRSPHDIVSGERAALASQWRAKAIAAFQCANPSAHKSVAETFVDAMAATALFSAPPPQGGFDDYYGWLSNP